MKSTKKTKILLSILVLSVIIGSGILNNQYFNINDYINHELGEDLKSSDNNGGGYILNSDATYNWEEINSTGTRLAISDQEWDYEDISFATVDWNFTFYGTEYDRISISTNGWMSFPNLGDTGGVIYDIPSIEQENIDCVALFSAYLSPYIGGDIYYEFFNDPNRLVIEYHHIYHYYLEELIGDFEAIFFENGTIKFQYKNIYTDIGYFGIGLDHGDLVNFNSYQPNLPIFAKAIEFTFNEMIEVSFTFNVEEDGQLSWLVSDVDDSLMQTYFGSNWESMFGLPPQPFEMSKIKIMVTSIEDNSTHWKLNYDLWNWTDKNDIFSLEAENADSLEFLQDPFNYNPICILPNIFPLILPCPSLNYIVSANLDSQFYDSISFDNINPQLMMINYHNFLGNGISITARVQYNEFGILTKLSFEYHNYNYDNFTMMLNLVNLHEGPKPSYIGFNEGDIYEYEYYNYTENAPDMGRWFYFPLDTKRIKNEIIFVGGEDPLTESTLVICNLSLLDSSDEWDDFIYSQTSAILIYRNATFYEQMYTIQNSRFFITGTDVDWKRFCEGFADSYPQAYNIMYSPLPNGFTVEQIDDEYVNETHYYVYTSSGILDHWIMYFDGKEFMRVSLVNSNYASISGSIIYLIFASLLLGVAVIVQKLKKRIFSSNT